jgi:hypothetical protein
MPAIYSRFNLGLLRNTEKLGFSVFSTESQETKIQNVRKPRQSRTSRIRFMIKIVG